MSSKKVDSESPHFKTKIKELDFFNAAKPKCAPVGGKPQTLHCIFNTFLTIEIKIIGNKCNTLSVTSSKPNFVRF